MGKADLHVHTAHSWDGTCTVSAVLRQASRQVGLDVIAITDHDEISGALEALSLAPSYNIEVIPGTEVSTSEGHLLALFVTEKVPANLSLLETVLHVRELGGLCIAAHPAAPGVSSLSYAAITQVAQNPEARGTLIGIEGFNASLVYVDTNPAARQLARQLGLAQTGGSDSHVPYTLGEGLTVFPGKSAADLRSALLARKTRGQARRLSNAVDVTFSWVWGYMLRLAGWVTWDPGPRLPLQLARLQSLQFNHKTTL
jgi:predicted metal-dependent phosphoesterase TrpH